MKPCLALFAALAGTGALAETHYFGGHYQCEKPSYTNIAVQYGQPAKVTVWFQARGSDNYNGFEGEAESWTEEGGSLSGGYNGILVKGRQATWLTRNGKPNEECTTFTLSPKETPLKEADKMLKLFKEAGTDAEGARAVNEADFALPPMEMLPELDQATYGEQLQEARNDYWTKLLQARAQAVATLPIEGDGATYIAKIKPLFDLDIGPGSNISNLGGYDSSELIFRQTATAAYRLALSGGNPQLARRSDEEICARTKHFGGLFGNERAVLIVGVPFSFWDREFTQPVIDALRACEQNYAKESADWLVKNFPRINEAHTAYAEIGKEIQNILKKPDTYETFVESNGVQPDKEMLEKYKIYHDRDIDMYSANLLNEKRERILKTLEAELPQLIEQQIATNQHDDAYKLCNAIFPNRDRVNGVNQLYQNCNEMAPSRLAQAALDKFTAAAEKADSIAAAEEIDWLVMPRVYHASEEALAAAEAKLQAPREKIAALIVAQADEAIRANSGKMIGQAVCPGSYNVPETIEKAMLDCANRIQAHNQAVEKAQCDAAVEAAGKAREIADAEIRLFTGYGREQAVGIRELICRTQSVDIHISGDGLFGSDRDMTLTKGDTTLKAVIDLDKDGVWTVTKVKGWKPKADYPLSACLRMDEDYCEKK